MNRILASHFARSLPPPAETLQPADKDICVQNIGPAERRKRLLSGVVLLAVSLALGLLLVLAGADRVWRLALFFPFAASAIGFGQARAKT